MSESWDPDLTNGIDSEGWHQFLKVEAQDLHMTSSKSEHFLEIFKFEWIHSTFSECTKKAANNLQTTEENIKKTITDVFDKYHVEKNNKNKFNQLKLNLIKKYRHFRIRQSKLWGPSEFAQPLLKSKPWEPPGGAMKPDSEFYVMREVDRKVIEAALGEGVTISIIGPRQVGKSTLIMQIIDKVKILKKIVFVDFQAFDEKILLDDFDRFLRQLCHLLTDSLGLEDLVDNYWARYPNTIQCCTRYVERYLLKEIQGSLMFAFDEVDLLLGRRYQSDFFGMLRSWHNNRALPTIPQWQRLDLILSTSTEPYLWIDNPSQSPFNVSNKFELSDFTRSQVADLNQRHATPFNLEQEEKLMSLLNGHPFLVRQALYLVASKRIEVESLFVEAAQDRSPFLNHLQGLLTKIKLNGELAQGLLKVINSGSCEDELLLVRLNGAGLIRWDGETVKPRCRLYADYFRRKLSG